MAGYAPGMGGGPPAAAGGGPLSSGAHSVVPPSVRTVIDGLAPADVEAVLAQLKALAASQPGYTRDLLLQSPMLAHAVLHLLARAGGLHTPSPA